jgi:hypothetical protein
MEKTDQKEQNNNLPPISNIDAAQNHFREALASGKHWYVALLESIGMWTDEAEIDQGQNYHYLIEGEAFDLLLLAERLCKTANGLVPDSEKFDLLFKNQPPLQLCPEEIINLIGECKYRQYLNFFYGVTVEEALIQAVREEVRKERFSNCWTKTHGEEEETYNKVYGVTQPALLRQFRQEKHYHLNSRSSLTELKEFIYWCFKYRVKNCEKAKVASDTHKALEWLRKNGLRC